MWRGAFRGLGPGVLNGVASLAFTAIIAALAFAGDSVAIPAEHATDEALRFVRGEAGSFAFDTGVLRGVLRQSGRSIGGLGRRFAPFSSSSRSTAT